MRPFAKADAAAVPFYETSWFGMIVRNAAALIAVLLVLFLAVRPLVNMLRSRLAAKGGSDGYAPMLSDMASSGAIVGPGYDREGLNAQIELAQRIAREQPDEAVQALRRLLAEDTGRKDAA